MRGVIMEEEGQEIPVGEEYAGEEEVSEAVEMPVIAEVGEGEDIIIIDDEVGEEE